MDRSCRRERSLRPARAVVAAVLVFGMAAVVEGAPPYKDSALPIEQRVQDLLGRMTVEEKIAQLHQITAWERRTNEDQIDEARLQQKFKGLSYGALDPQFGSPFAVYARRIRASQDYARTKTRLGIPFFPLTETLHGVLSVGATIYPQTIAQGATWNPLLIKEMAAAIAREGSAMGIVQALAPMLYTTFSYSDLRIETPTVPTDGLVRLSFNVTNTGGREGKEVAQVYFRDEVSSVTTPMKRLIRFEKISLAAGETRRIKVSFPADELAVWNTEMKRVVEPGVFRIMVGPNAEDIELSAKFEVK